MPSCLYGSVVIYTSFFSMWQMGATSLEIHKRRHEITILIVLYDHTSANAVLCLSSINAFRLYYEKMLTSQRFRLFNYTFCWKLIYFGYNICTLHMQFHIECRCRWSNFKTYLVPQNQTQPRSFIRLVFPNITLN